MAVSTNSAPCSLPSAGTSLLHVRYTGPVADEVLVSSGPFDRDPPPPASTNVARRVACQHTRLNYFADAGVAASAGASVGFIIAVMRL